MSAGRFFWDLVLLLYISQNQGACGSCYAQAAVGVAEMNTCIFKARADEFVKGKFRVKEDFPASDFEYSVQDLISCGTGKHDNIKPPNACGREMGNNVDDFANYCNGGRGVPGKSCALPDPDCDHYSNPAQTQHISFMVYAWLSPPSLTCTLTHSHTLNLL